MTCGCHCWGLHQVENAVAAVLAVEALRSSWHRRVEQSRCATAWRRSGGQDVWRCSGVGRSSSPMVRTMRNRRAGLCETLRDDLGFSKATFVIGVSRDKDTTGMERELRPMAARLIATSSQHPRAMEAERVAAAFSLNGVSATPIAQVSEAVDAAMSQGGPDELVCVLGSLFVAAEAREHVLGIEHEVIG